MPDLFVMGPNFHFYFKQQTCKILLYLTMTSDELKISDNLVAYWTNVAKNSNPNIGLPVTDILPTFQSNGPLSLCNLILLVRSFQITERSFVTSELVLGTRYLSFLEDNNSFTDLCKHIIIKSTYEALQNYKYNVQWQLELIETISII